MTDQAPEVLTEEEAARLWQRAAELQAEAAADVKVPAIEGASAPSTGYALTHVRSAAVQAGISSEFIDAALADLRLERSRPAPAKVHGLARVLLKNPPDAVTVRRVVAAAPEDVLTAMQTVFSSEPFRLTLTDQEGDSLDGGMLVFDIPGIRNPFDGGFAYTAREGGLRQLRVSLRPVEGATQSSEITIHSARTTHNLALGVSIFASTLTGAMGFGAFLGIGVATGIGPLPAIPGILLGAGAGLIGFRAVYRFAIRRARRAIEGMVGAVAARAKGGEASESRSVDKPGPWAFRAGYGTESAAPPAGAPHSPRSGLGGTPPFLLLRWRPVQTPGTAPQPFGHCRAPFSHSPRRHTPGRSHP